MYIKIADEKMPLKNFHKTTNHILFAFDQDIESDAFTDVTSFEMYSDDDIFLSKYTISEYILKINANELYLKIPTTKDINLYKQEKIEFSKQLLANWLQNNPLLYTDGKYYSVTSEKQSLLNGNLASYERALNIDIKYPLKWNSTGEECVEWEYSDLLTLSLTIAAYVSPKIAKQQQIEIDIRNCNSIEEIDDIIIDYGDSDNITNENVSE